MSLFRQRKSKIFRGISDGNEYNIRFYHQKPSERLSSHPSWYSYVVREPTDRSWGKELSNGSWTGTVGPMQRSQADFSTVLAPTPGRLKAINHERLYQADELSIISLKPMFLVDYLAIVKPYTEDTWALLSLTAIVWVFLLWFMEKVWSTVSGKKSISFGSTLFYGWGILLEDSPAYRPANSAGQIMTGWWLMACMVIQLAYRSSLMAHLIVLEKSKPIDAFSDLLQLKDWSWGIEPWMLSGAVGVFFTTTQDRVMQQVYMKFERGDMEENLEKVLSGGHSFVAWRNPGSIAIASRYPEGNRNPFYISKYGYSVLASFGWGFRKGAPFRSRFRQLMDRVIESGILEHWQKVVIDGRIRERRRQSQKETNLENEEGNQQDTGEGETAERNVVLALKHLQAAFFIFFLGHGTAFLALLGETGFGWRLKQTKESKA